MHIFNLKSIYSSSSVSKLSVSTRSFLNTFSKINSQQKSESQPKTIVESNISSSSPPSRTSYTDIVQKGTVSRLDKLYLVGYGKYKNASEIPPAVDIVVLQRVRSWGRIRLNLIFIGIGAVASFFMIQAGKASAREGDTIEKRNRDWHKKIKEEHELSLISNSSSVK